MYIKRKISKSLTTFKNLRLLHKYNENSLKRYKVTVGIGGNIGDVRRRFIHLITAIKRDKQVDLLETSLILKNPPFGFLDQDDFFNSIMILQVNMQPKQILAYLMRLEKKFARQRSFADAPRTLDLDIIFFDERTIQTKKLTIPHIDYLNRDSVLIPLKAMQ